MQTFDISNLSRLLRHSIHDAVVCEFFGPSIDELVRNEYYGWITFEGAGLEAIFIEAEWMFDELNGINPHELHLSAFHLHSEGHEEYSGFVGNLPNNIIFGDKIEDVIEKIGVPVKFGEGNFSSTLKYYLPNLIKYDVGEHFLTLTFSPRSELELVTLHTPNLIDQLRDAAPSEERS